MLNAQEKEWLERRKNLCNRCVKASWCRTGEKCGYNTERCRFWELKVPNQRSIGSLDEDFQDAAEFEARVAIWLLDHDHEDVPCAHGMDIFCPRPRPPFVDKGCGKWCLLRCARLVIEQEMNNE